MRPASSLLIVCDSTGTVSANNATPTPRRSCCCVTAVAAIQPDDTFASLGEESNPTLGELTPTFEQALTRLLECGDRRAPARLVFYPVVQIGGDIPADSPLGRAALPVLGDDFQLASLDDGDHARDFVVPMYHNVMQTEGLHPRSPESPDGG